MMAQSLFKKSGPVCSCYASALRAGFTLIELLVVISIIATLTAILLPNFMGARDRASDAQKKQDLVAVKNALRLFYNDTQNYPAYSRYPVFGTTLGTTLAPYMPSASGVGFTYSYYSTGNGDDFQLCSEMNSGADENKSSQLQCQSGGTVCGTGLTSDVNLYVVCAN